MRRGYSPAWAVYHEGTNAHLVERINEIFTLQNIAAVCVGILQKCIFNYWRYPTDKPLMASGMSTLFEIVGAYHIWGIPSGHQFGISLQSPKMGRTPELSLNCIASI
jgi:hypothetical protein